MSSVPSSDLMDPVLRFFDERPDPAWQWAFDHSAAGESPVNAIALGNLALLAYSGQRDMVRYLEAWGFTDIRFLNVGATAGFVARIADPDTGAGSVFISFRGTEPAMVADWLSDVQYHQTPLRNLPGQVHGGFGRAFSLVFDQTKDAIDALPGARHFFTGHSLGGALAVLAAAILNPQVTTVYTYGQPRVGDQAFSEAYDQALGNVTFRYVNNFDLVPHLPPEKLPAAFPPIRFPNLPRGILDFRQDLVEAVGAVNTLIAGERFAHVGQLRLFIDGQAVSQDMADFRARDPFDVPLDPLEAIRRVRSSLIADFSGARLIDHDPFRGYLPRLQIQLPPVTA
jgi:hypothetical protein